MRPYVMAGLGATSFGDVAYSTPTRAGTISGLTRFSTTWGAGVKVYGNAKYAHQFDLSGGITVQF